MLLTCALTAVIAGVALPARATMEADPEVLYQQMKAAYDKAAAAQWDFRDQEIYLSTIFNAGRAYALQRPDDPAFAQLETLTVQIGSGLHYNPLTNHDAAVWYVREAAVWVSRNSTDPTLVGEANALLERVNSEDDPEKLAALADQDARANAATYPADVDTRLQTLEANWRGWLLTNDPSWRSLAFQKAAQTNFPLAHLPTTYGPAFVQAAENAAAGVGNYTAGDRANAKIIVQRLKDLTSPLIIATVTSMPADKYLTTLAPADEYFGQMGYSILGIENELKRINFMLNYNYGNREAAQTVLVAQSIDDMHKVYPRDRDMPKLLYSCLTTLERMNSPDAVAAASHLRGILTVEYQDSPQARKVLAAQ
ncbi:MAG TPA: hypothetical protein VMF11_04670 [Candidatus Baltobacteraceae bacterium]|nr:hypothetical protein [Candidatus Baltobacteraceae bacterium]